MAATAYKAIERSRIGPLLLSYFGLSRNALRYPEPNQKDVVTTFPRKIAVFTATAAPVSSDAASIPTGKGDLCLVLSASPTSSNLTTQATALYRCSAYTNTTTFTWTLLF